MIIIPYFENLNYIIIMEKYETIYVGSYHAVSSANHYCSMLALVDLLATSSTGSNAQPACKKLPYWSDNQ